MSNKKSEINSKYNVAGELLLPIFGIIFTTYYFSTIIDSPWTAQVNAVMVGLILIIVCSIFFIRKLLEVITDKAVFRVPYQKLLPALKTQQTAFITLTIGYLFFVEFFGYTLATIFFLWSSMTLLDNGRRTFVKLLLAITMGAVSYTVFILMFETRLPKGLIEEVLKGVFVK